MPTRARILVAFLLTLSACSSDGDGAVASEGPTSAIVTTNSPVPTTASDPSGGVARVAMVLPTSLNNAMAFGPLWWARGYDYDAATLEQVPIVLEQIPSLANGGVVIEYDGAMKVRWTIDSDAVWEDGSPITGDDLAYTFERVVEEYASLGLDVLRYGADGPQAFEAVFAQPTLIYRDLFAVVYPHRQMAGTDPANDWTEQLWMSGGPFRLSERTARGLIFERNPNYWRTDPATGGRLPYLDRIEVLLVEDEAEAVAAFQRRDVDVVGLASTPDLAAVASSLTSDGAHVDVIVGTMLDHFAFQYGDNRLDVNPGSYNEYLEFRMAISHAVDRTALAETVYPGLGMPLDSYLAMHSPSLPSEGWQPYGYDPGAARRQIELLCARPAVDCEARPPTVVLGGEDDDLRSRIAAALGPMIEAVGITFETRFESPESFYSTVFSGSWDHYEFALALDPGISGLLYVHDFFYPGGPPWSGYNYSRWGTPAVAGEDDAAYNQGASSVRNQYTERAAELIEQTWVEVDPNRLRQLFIELEQIYSDQMVFIPLFARPEGLAVWPDVVAGTAANPSASGILWNVETWRRP